MKKGIIITIIIIIIAIVLAIFIGRGDKSQNDIPTVASNTSNYNDGENGYMFKIKNKEIKLNSIFDNTTIGEPKEYSEIPSCAFDGVDKVYTFEDYEIETYQDGENFRIYSIYFLNENAETAEGIKIGSTLDDVKGIYGENYEINDTMYTYISGKTKLDFIVENNVVTSITYTLITV